MNFAQRKTVYTNLNTYCHMAKPHEVIEVTEWTNGEGWDVSIGTRNIQLTFGELQALTVLCNVSHPREAKCNKL